MQSGTSNWLELYTFKILGRKEELKKNVEITHTQDIVGMYLLYAVSHAVAGLNQRGFVSKEDRPKIIAFIHYLHVHCGHVPEELRLIGDACTSDIRVQNAARLLHNWAANLSRLVTEEQAMRGRDAFQKRYGIILQHADGLERVHPVQEVSATPLLSSEAKRPASARPAAPTPPPLQ